MNLHFNDKTLNEFNLSNDLPAPDITEQQALMVKCATSMQSVLSADNSNDSNVSSSENESSLGSEFGDSINNNDLKVKLPQVKKEIATMLKLNAWLDTFWLFD